MYTEKDFVRIAKRENNTRRSFLIVDPLQGKHIPVSPSKAMNVFSDIAGLIKKEYGNEKLLIVGFAETATAIGAQLAVDLQCDYIQTTREILDGSQYLFFSEEHSHAAEQKLVRNGLDEKIASYGRIIFTDDEISTGKTILNIISAMEKAYGRTFRFAAASILNGMNAENLDSYKSRNINLHYLVKTNPDMYEKTASSMTLINDDDSYIKADCASGTEAKPFTAEGLKNPRMLIDSKEYLEGCMKLWKDVNRFCPFKGGSDILVLGTEEFMYPAMYIGKQLEQSGCRVRFHATTRSPISVSSEDSYPLHRRYELKSMYDSERTTFIYDIAPCDSVLIVTDAPSVQDEGLNSLVNALKHKCRSIFLVRWSK